MSDSSEGLVMLVLVGIMLGCFMFLGIIGLTEYEGTDPAGALEQEEVIDPASRFGVLPYNAGGTVVVPASGALATPPVVKGQ